MTATVPNRIPTTIRAGDTVLWDFNAPDYLPGDSWVATVEFRNAGGTINKTIDATANGELHRFEVTAAVSATWSTSAGQVFYLIYVTKATQRFSLERGNLEVLTNLETATTFDGRSHVKTTLDAIEATLEGRASKDQESYSVNGVSLARTPIAELIELRKQYLAWYEIEQRRLAIEQGRGHSGKIRTRFVRPS